MSQNTKSQHPKHNAEIPCLNRTIGQLEGVKKMIDEERYCVDILTQLKAVRSALKRIELNILETHMQRCLEAAAKSGDAHLLSQKIIELRDLIGKF